MSDASDTVEPALDKRAKTTAVVLAGGRARRMAGEDKGLVTLRGQPMVSHVVSALKPQVGMVLISANRNVQNYAKVTGCKVIEDYDGEYAGPLAGMASAMAICTTPFLLTSPCDSPLICADLAARLHDGLARERAEIAVAHDGARLQPVFALLRCVLRDSVEAYLASGERKIDRWYALHRMARVDFSDRLDTFLNINTPEERAAMETRLAREGSSA